MPAVPVGGTGVGSGITTGDLIEEFRQRAFSGQEEKANRLDGAVLVGATTMALKYASTAVTSGTILGVGLEDVRVWENTGPTLTVVERGVNGTIPAAHADLDYVAVSPKFSKARVLRAFNEELGALSSPLNGLFQMMQVELTYNPAAAGYDLTGVMSLDDIYVIETRFTGATRDWEPVPARAWRHVRDANATDFPSGLGLFLNGGGQPGQPLRVWYKAPFTLLSTTELAVDVNGMSGLPESANDLLVLGAQIRLVPPRDIKRTFTESQGDTRRADEVPVNAATQSISGLARYRQQRIAEEAAVLSRRYPARSRAA